MASRHERSAAIDGNGCYRAGHRLREFGQSPACASHKAAKRNRYSPRSGRIAVASGPATVNRECCLVGSRRWGWRSHRTLGQPSFAWALSFPGGDPVRLDLSWDAKLASFAVTVTLGCALLFGLAPTFGATQISLSSAMNNGVATGKPRSRLMNSVLVVMQVALSLAVLVSAGLLARTLQALRAQDPGYDPQGVVTAHANWPGGRENAMREVLVGE